MTAALAASMLAFTAGPAFAGGCSTGNPDSPDARVKVGNGPWIGGGQTGEQSVYLGIIQPGVTRSYLAKWKNTSGATDTVRVRGFRFEKEDGMRIKVFLNGENVTRRFRDADPGITFHDLAPNAVAGVFEVRFKNVGPAATPYGEQGLYGFFKGAGNGQCDAVIGSANAME